MNEKDISVIIPYRYLDDYRKNNLFCVINYMIEQFPEIDILVLEQDKAPTLQDNNKFFNMFIYNNGLFNRSWALNVGMKVCKNNYCLLLDGDLLMKKENLLECFNQIENFDSVVPYNERVILTEKQTKLYYDKIDYFDKVEFEIKGGEPAISSGMWLVDKKKVQEIGGFCEKFQGYGGEDNEMGIRAIKFLQTKRMPFSTYHLYHPRDNKNDYINHNHYTRNVFI